MLQLLKKLAFDQNGMIISSEIVLVGTILVLGSIVGLATLSHAVNNELQDVAQACDRAYSCPGTNPDSHAANYRLASSKSTPEIKGSSY